MVHDRDDNEATNILNETKQLFCAVKTTGIKLAVL